ncbi:MAG: hypothetical protein J0L75_13215 [Spirochaetes bacterium]|nr:hypothetical protein [Spirochaetota bacterium]
MRVSTLFLALLLALPLTAEFIPGFREFRYFMSPPEVKNLLAKEGFSAGDLTETFGELYLKPYIAQDFTAYERRGRQFYSCSFTTNIRGLIAATEGKVFHLTSRNALDFMQISIPPFRTTNDYREWEQKYLFYKNPAAEAQGLVTNAYQLFAIVFTYRGFENTGDWSFLKPGTLAEVEKELRAQYGLPDYVDLTLHDRLTRIMRQSYRHTLSGGNTTDYRLDVQVTASWARFGGREANLQITHMTEQFSALFLINLSLGDYKVPSLDWSQIIGGREAMLKAGRVFGEDQPIHR